MSATTAAAPLLDRPLVCRYCKLRMSVVWCASGGCACFGCADRISKSIDPRTGKARAWGWKAIRWARPS